MLGFCFSQVQRGMFPHVSELSSNGDCAVYLFYLPFDPKPVAIAVTFVTQHFQFNFNCTIVAHNLQATLCQLLFLLCPLFIFLSTLFVDPLSKKMLRLISFGCRKATIQPPTYCIYGESICKQA